MRTAKTLIRLGDLSSLSEQVILLVLSGCGSNGYFYRRQICVILRSSENHGQVMNREIVINIFKAKSTPCLILLSHRLFLLHLHYYYNIIDAYINLLPKTIKVPWAAWLEYDAFPCWYNSISHHSGITDECQNREHAYQTQTNCIFVWPFGILSFNIFAVK